MTSLNISLPETMRAWVEEKVAKGGYGTASELMRELIRDAQSREVPPSPSGEDEAASRTSTAAALLPFAGSWEGDDLDGCLQSAYAARSSIRP